MHAAMLRTGSTEVAADCTWHEVLPPGGTQPAAGGTSPSYPHVPAGRPLDGFGVVLLPPRVPFDEGAASGRESKGRGRPEVGTEVQPRWALQGEQGQQQWGAERRPASVAAAASEGVDGAGRVEKEDEEDEEGEEEEEVEEAEAMEAVPVGQEGEVCVSGPGVIAAGYLGVLHGRRTASSNGRFVRLALKGQAQGSVLWGGGSGGSVAAQRSAEVIAAPRGGKEGGGEVEGVNAVEGGSRRTGEVWFRTGDLGVILPSGAQP